VLSFDTADFAFIEEELHHSAEEHVDKCIDPQGRKEDEERLGGQPIRCAFELLPPDCGICSHRIPRDSP
jgi:hypothetical protein